MEHISGKHEETAVIVVGLQLQVGQQCEEPHRVRGHTAVLHGIQTGWGLYAPHGRQIGAYDNKPCTAVRYAMQCTVIYPLLPESRSGSYLELEIRLRATFTAFDLTKATHAFGTDLLGL